MAEEPDGIMTLTSWSNGCHFCFVIGWSGVQSSVWRPDITTDISRGFYQSLRTNSTILYLRVGHDHFLPLSFQLITLCRRIISATSYSASDALNTDSNSHICICGAMRLHWTICNIASLEPLPESIFATLAIKHVNTQHWRTKGHSDHSA